MKAVSIWYGLPASLALHAYTVGGIGLMVIGMMSRVALGHTGRNVFDPPKILTPMFLLVILSTLLRIALPIVDDTHEVWLIALSQLCWAIGFGLFSITYIPILMGPRVNQSTPRCPSP